MHQVKIDLMELSADSIIRKIKAFVNDSDLVGLSLIVQRKKKVENKKQLLKNKKEEQDIEKEEKSLFTGSELTNEKNNIEGGNNYNLQKGKINHIGFLRDNRMQKAKRHYTQGHYDTAIKIYQEIHQEILSDKSRSPDYIEGDKERKLANITFQLANCYYHKKNYQKSIQLYKMEFVEENLKHKAMRKSNLGTIYLQKEQFQLSLKYYSDALTIYNQCQFDEIDLSNTYYNVGRIYLRENMFKNSSQFFAKAIEERKLKSPGSQLPLFESIFKLGVSLRGQKKYEESLKSFQYALSFAERGVGDLVEVLKEIADSLECMGKDEEALNIYEKLADFANGSEQDKAYAYERAGIIILNKNNSVKGKNLLKLAQKTYQKIGNLEKSDSIHSQFLFEENQLTI